MNHDPQDEAGLLLEFLQQRLCRLQIHRIKALRKPVVHWREQIIRLLALGLLLPQARQAGGGAQFEGLGLLVRAMERAWWKDASAWDASGTACLRSNAPLRRYSSAA